MAEPSNTPNPASTPRSASPTPSPAAAVAAGATLPILTSHLVATHLAASLAPPAAPHLQPPSSHPKPRVLHIGDDVSRDWSEYVSFAAHCEAVRPSAAESKRQEFLRALRERKWGDFEAVWGSGAATSWEMGEWDEELIQALPDSVRVFASAGVAVQGDNVQLLRNKGIFYCNSSLDTMGSGFDPDDDVESQMEAEELSMDNILTVLAGGQPIMPAVLETF